MSKQISAALVLGLSAAIDLRGLDIQQEITFGFDVATVSGSFTFYGTLDSTATTTTNAQVIDAITVTPGMPLPAGLVRQLLNWPYILIDAPGSATFYANGDAATPIALASATAPTTNGTFGNDGSPPAAGNYYSTLLDCTAFSGNAIRVMGSKNMTSSDTFAVFGYQDPATNPVTGGADGGVMLGNFTGGGASLVIDAWPYISVCKTGGSTAGTVKAAGAEGSAGGGGGGPVIVGTLSVGNTAGGGFLGGLSAAATVDRYDAFDFAQTTALQTLTLHDPSTTTATRLVTVTNTGTTPAIWYGALVPVGATVSLVWNGTTWGASVAIPPLSQVATKTGSYTPNFGESVPVDVSGGNVAITAPVISAGSKGQRIAVSVVTTAATIAAAAASLVPGAGNTINGSSTTIRLSGKASIVLESNGGTDWTIVTQPAIPGAGALTNGDATSPRLGQLSLYVLAAGTLTADHINTLSVTGAVAGDWLIVVRRDLSSFLYTVIGATSVVLPGSVFGSCAFQFDGTAWQPVSTGSALPSIQTGTTTLAGGVSPAISVNLRATSVIFFFLIDPSGAQQALTVKFAALTADRVIGSPGSFKVTALLAAGTINNTGGPTSDTSTGSYVVIG